jgi:hypothetical protein
MKPKNKKSKLIIFIQIQICLHFFFLINWAMPMPDIPMWVDYPLLFLPIWLFGFLAIPWPMVVTVKVQQQ